MQDVLADVLHRRKQRAIAIILGVKERECDKHLPPPARDKLRKVILDQMNDFYDVVTDIMSSLDNGDVVLNGDYLEKLDQIHSTVVGAAASRSG